MNFEKKLNSFFVFLFSHPLACFCCGDISGLYYLPTVRNFLIGYSIIIMRHLLLFICAIAFYFNATAQTGVSYHTDKVANGYNYLLYTPDSTAIARPLIIALHSRGSSGTNLQDVDYFGTIDAIESGMKLDAYVIAPQATGADWDTDRVMNVVDYALSNYNIDSNRIYAIGMSMGGNGVANLVAANPEKIAAAIILAGSITKGNAIELSKVPLWIIRGTNDREEAIRRTDNMVEEIKRQNSSRIVYSKIKGLDHRQHERILYMPYFYEWLMSHNLTTSNRPINPTTEVTTKMLKDSYNGLRLRKGSATKRKSRSQGARGAYLNHRLYLLPTL